MENLRQYPQDVASIQRCMTLIGGRHPPLVAGKKIYILLNKKSFIQEKICLFFFLTIFFLNHLKCMQIFFGLNKESEVYFSMCILKI